MLMLSNADAILSLKEIQNFFKNLDQFRILHKNTTVCVGSSSESSSSSPKYHPNNRRGIGDGSSRQGSLTPANFESSLTSMVGDKEMLKGLQMKYEEESTIRLLELIRLNLNHIPALISVRSVCLSNCSVLQHY